MPVNGVSVEVRAAEHCCQPVSSTSGGGRLAASSICKGGSGTTRVTSGAGDSGSRAAQGYVRMLASTPNDQN